MAIHPLPLLLASRSQSRQALLRQTGITFDSLESTIDESAITGKTPQERILKLAQAKALDVSQKIDYPALILAADTFLIFNRRILEKPKFKLTAVEMLKGLSGKVHVVLTGWAILNTYKGTWQTGTSDTSVTFRELSHQEIVDYVDDNPVVQWAGGYNSQLSAGSTFIHSVKGSLTGLNGLPLDQVIPALKHEWAHPYKKKLSNS